jgi:hypothetical protein
MYPANVPVKWNVEYIKAGFACNNYFGDFANVRLPLPAQTPSTCPCQKEGAGEEVPAPWDAFAPIVSYPAIKPDNFPFVKDGSVTSRLHFGKCRTPTPVLT